MNDEIYQAQCVQTVSDDGGGSITDLYPQCADPEYAVDNPSICASSIAITGLSVVPSSGTIRIGNKYPFKAFLQFSNGKTKDVSDKASWSIDDGAVGSIENGTEGGKALGVATGTTSVQADYRGLYANASLTVQSECTNAGIDFVLVFDRSGSMKEIGDSLQTRLDMSKTAAKSLVDNIDTSKDQVSIVSFSGKFTTTISGVSKSADSTQHIVLSSNRDDINAAIDSIAVADPCEVNLSNGQTWRCNTGIGGGLEMAYDELSSTRATDGSRKVVVLLTDGAENIWTPDPETVATSITGAGWSLVVIALGIGESDTSKDALGSSYVVSDWLAALSNSNPACELYFSATTPDLLPDIYARLPDIICDGIASDPCFALDADWDGITLVENATCPRSYTIQWSPKSGATGYKVQSRDVGSSTWSDVATVSVTSYDPDLPYQVNKEYRVGPVESGSVDAYSDPVTVQALTIIGVMNALQERMINVGLTPVVWTDGGSGVQTYLPSNYYDTWLVTHGEQGEADLISEIGTALLNTSEGEILSKYTNQSDLDGVTEAQLTTYDSLEISPITALSDATTIATREADLLLYATQICALQYAVIDASAVSSSMEVKQSSAITGQNTLGEALDLASSGYDSATWTDGSESGILARVEAWAYQDVLDPFAYNAQYQSQRVTLTGDLTAIGSTGSCKLFYLISAPTPDSNPYVPAAGNKPPYNDDNLTWVADASPGKYRLAHSIELPETTYTTDPIGSYKSSQPTNNQVIGWTLRDAKFFVSKSNVSASAEWTYYP